MFFYALDYLSFILLPYHTVIPTMKWVGTILIVTSAVIISTNLSLSMVAFPYGLFLIGHCFWAIAAWMTKELPLFWLNFGIIPIDWYAILIRTG